MFRAILAVLVVWSSVVAGVPAAITADQDVNLVQRLLSRVEKLEADLIAVNHKVDGQNMYYDEAGAVDEQRKRKGKKA